MGGGGWYEPIKRPTPERDEKGKFIPEHRKYGDPLPGRAPPTDELAIHQYNDLRFTCHELEELIASGECWSEKDLKRLDKAVTVMKVGFKILKKVLHARSKKAAKPVSFVE